MACRVAPEQRARVHESSEQDQDLVASGQLGIFIMAAGAPGNAVTAGGQPDCGRPLSAGAGMSA